MEFLHVADLLFPGWNTVKLDKERFDKEQIGVKVQFPMSSLPIYFIRIRNIWRKGTILGYNQQVPYHQV